jgi:hypothetical protein
LQGAELLTGRCTIGLGLHGKNRLAGNSLLECVIFGRIAGQRAAVIKKHLTQPGILDFVTSQYISPLSVLIALLALFVGAKYFRASLHSENT